MAAKLASPTESFPGRPVMIERGGGQNGLSHNRFAAEDGTAAAAADGNEQRRRRRAFRDAWQQHPPLSHVSPSQASGFGLIPASWDTQYVLRDHHSTRGVRYQDVPDPLVQTPNHAGGSQVARFYPNSLAGFPIPWNQANWNLFPFSTLPSASSKSIALSEDVPQFQGQTVFPLSLQRRPHEMQPQSQPPATYFQNDALYPGIEFQQACPPDVDSFDQDYMVELAPDTIQEDWDRNPQDFLQSLSFASAAVLASSPPVLTSVASAASPIAAGNAAEVTAFCPPTDPFNFAPQLQLPPSHYNIVSPDEETLHGQAPPFSSGAPPAMSSQHTTSGPGISFSGPVGSQYGIITPPPERTTPLEATPSAVLLPPGNDLQIVQCGPPRPGTKGKGKVALNKSKPSREKVLRDETGCVQGYTATFGVTKNAPSRVLSDEQRTNKKRARTVGSCSRCRRLKIRCDLHMKNPYEPCSACLANKQAYKGAIKLPCFRSKIGEATFFRSRPCSRSPLDTTRPEVYDLTEFGNGDAGFRSIILSQDGGKSILSVFISSFDSHHGDKTAYKWTKGNQTHTLNMPHYCLTGLDGTRMDMKAHIHNMRKNHLYLIEDTSELTKRTIGMALDYAKLKKGSLVDQALSMWVASRVIEVSWQVYKETPEFPEINDPECPWYQKRPITPIMDTQLDQIVIQHILNPLRENVLRNLSNLLDRRTPEMWFEIYLTSFILLNSIERGFAHSKQFARRYGLQTPYADPRMVDQWIHTCNIILAHFHFVCNGSTPLHADWDNPKYINFAKLDESQVNFMKDTQTLARDQALASEELRAAREYDRDQFFSHQLFFSEWRPN